MWMRGQRDSTKSASRSSAQDQIGESIGVTEMMIGKWYDPISQRWIVPREARPVAGYSQSNPEERARNPRIGRCGADLGPVGRLLRARLISEPHHHSLCCRQFIE
ncbi:hypothetical protein ACVWZW_006554 [Bradyrhizobium sp. F1.13.4]